MASDGAAFHYFGWVVSLYGERALVGWGYKDDDRGSDSGSAYVFERAGRHLPVFALAADAPPTRISILIIITGTHG